LNGLDPQTRMAMISLAEADAQTALQMAIDDLVGQGQKHFYGGNNWWKWSGNGMWVTQPWGGDKVATLGLPVQPSTPPNPGRRPPPPPPIPPDPDDTDPTPTLSTGAFIYAPTIKSLDGSTAPGIATYPSVNLPIDAMIVIYTGEQVRVTLGAADTGDPEQYAPPDYNATINNKHYQKVL
jgi:hypothetical protein